MIPVVFINCAEQPYLNDILSGRKQYETRSRDMLAQLVGRRVLLAETGNGRPIVRASAIIRTKTAARSRLEWALFRSGHCVPEGSRYDWGPGARVKYLYRLIDVQPVSPFIPPEGVRHGRVWMEYEGGIPT